MKIKVEYANDTFESEFADDGIEEAVKQFSIMLQSCGYHYETVKDYIDIGNDCISQEDYNNLNKTLELAKSELISTKNELFEARETITKGFIEQRVNTKNWIDRIYYNSTVDTFNKDIEVERFKFKSLKKTYDALTIKLAECRSNNSRLLEEHAFKE